MTFARPLLLSLALALAPMAEPAFADMAGDVQRRLEEGGGVVRLGDREVDLAPLRDFYRQRGYRLAWSGTAAEAKGDKALLDVQAVAMAEGLAPDSYTVPATVSDIERDLLISDALARFGRDLATGRVPPSKTYGGLGPETRPGFDAAAFLKALSAGKAVAAAVEPLPPAFAGYHRLLVALDRYRQIARDGGWPTIPEGPSIKPGDQDDRVPLVRRRLIATGDLAPAHDKGKTLDAPVVAALKAFQLRHGLGADGAVGRQTLAALNVPAEQRLSQLLVNLERWRWMPRTLDPVHVAVNLPAARLELVENGEVTMAMRVVVGDVKHPTPGLTTTMSSVVLNPTWTIPPSIASKEILPKLRKDPNYLAANNIRILDAFPEDSPQAGGRGMDWAGFRGGKFPYRLRQQPGPDNALGYVKFNLKDSDDIYLHDTPSRAAFSRDYRALSHGCVRVERPVDLAEALLGDAWADKVAETITTAETRTLKLEREVRVYLTYFTAWADGAGVVHFRDDLYGHDGRLRAALKRARPAAKPPQVAEEHAPRPL
ncbi:MAG: L,D-transpeptidase family protein [Pseudomonadota bacterium]